MSLFCYALLCDHSGFAIILKRKRKLIALLFVSFCRSIVTRNVLWLFLVVPWVGQCLIVVFLENKILTYFFILLFCPFESEVDLETNADPAETCYVAFHFMFSVCQNK